MISKPARAKSKPCAGAGSTSAIGLSKEPVSISGSIAAALPIKGLTARRRCISARSLPPWSAMAKPTDLGDRNRAAKARNDERDRLRNDKDSGLGRDYRPCGRTCAPGSRTRIARSDPHAKPAQNPRYPDRAAGHVQPRRSQSRAREGDHRSERADGTDRSDSGAAGCDRAQGDRRGPGIALHDKSRFAG